MPRALLVLALVLGWSSAAAAQAALLETTITVGKPARATVVRVAPADAGVEITIGSLRHTLAGVQATAASVEIVALAGGSIGLLTVSSAAEQHLVLVGERRKPSVAISSFIIGLRGDPGERRGHALLRDDINGDGQADLRIAEQHEAARDCTGAMVPVRVRHLDGATLALAPPVTALSRIGASGAAQLSASEAAATLGIQDGSPVRIQASRSRWTTSGASDAAFDPMPNPSAASDRDANTSVSLAADSTQRAVFALRTAPLGIKGVAITLKSAPGGSVPAMFFLRGNTGGWFHVTLPTGAMAAKRYVVAIPDTPAWTCLEVAGTDTPAPALDIAEIEALTEADLPGGLTRLVGRIVTDDRSGSEVAALLASLGGPGLTALANGWEQLGPRGKRRATIALHDHAEQSAAARQLLARAAQDADAEVADRAFAALERHPKVAFAELAALAASANRLAIRAIGALGASGHPDAPSTLLGLLDAEGAVDRPELRAAVVSALSSAGNAAAAPAQAWVSREHPVAVRAVAIGVLASCSPTRALAQQLWATIRSESLEFPELWRTVDGARLLDASPDVDAWLTELATKDERWMLRDAALRVLAARQSPQLLATATQSLRDEYPRVRATAARMLMIDTHRQQVVDSFASEEWPLVRAEILATLEPRHDPQIALGALTDTSMAVRGAAISALTRLKAAHAWTEVAKRLTDSNEWPAVMSSAIEMASALCITDATTDLKYVLRRGLKPDAWAPDVDLAMESIAALGRLGTEASRNVLRALQKPDQPQPIRDAATRALALEACSPTSANLAAPVNH